MLRGILIGFAIGAAASAALFKLLESRRAEPERPLLSGVLPADPGGGGAGDAGKEGAALREALAQVEALRAENRQLREQVLALATEAAPGRRKLRDDLWKEVAGKLGPLLAKSNLEEVMEDPEAQAALVELFAVVAQIAKAYGVSQEEAILSPEGIPLFMIAALDSSATPPSPEQRRRLQAVLEEARGGWDRFLADRGDMWRLERRLRALEIGSTAYAAMDAELTEEQRRLTGRAGVLGAGIGESTVWREEGRREEVVEALQGAWSRVLKLDAEQGAGLRPVADEYVRACEADRRRLQDRRAAGEEVSEAEVMRMRMQAMVEVQKRIPSRTSLTAEQAEALKNWTVVYEVEVRD